MKKKTIINFICVYLMIFLLSGYSIYEKFRNDRLNNNIKEVKEIMSSIEKDVELLNKNDDETSKEIDNINSSVKSIIERIEKIEN